jgi:glycyl-tRNA synthetase
LEHAYDEEVASTKDSVEHNDEETRIVLRFKKEVSPVNVAVLPLLTRQELIEPSKEIANRLREKGLLVAYDDSGTIGRRYRRNDEIGTPYCVTIDYDTLKDGTVTIRDRDSMQQVRAEVATIEEVLYDMIYRDKKFETAGKPV